MRINSRKIQKILRRIWTAPKRICETLSTQEAPGCIGMNATHNFLVDSENQTRIFFLCYIPCKENKCWKKILKL
jgi:hypothetical protein